MIGMIGKVNIELELKKIRKKIFDPQEELLNEARKIIRFGVIPTREPAFPVYDYFSNPMENLEKDRIFNLEEIRRVCVKYRLRFLDLSSYKEALPPFAFKAMQNLEDRIGYVPEYKLIAPASFFRLKDRDKDPLLFARISEDKFFLVTKWGEDLSAIRAVVAFPFQTLESFLAVLSVICLSVSFILPAEWLVNGPENINNIFYYRSMLFCWSLIVSFFFLVFIGLTFRKNFNDAEWDSKYFN